MFFNKVLITNPDPSALETKINRTTLDIYYMASLLEEDLLDPEEGETAEEVSAALKELESNLAVMKAELEAVVAIQKYFFVKEAAEAQEEGPEETRGEYFAVCSDLEYNRPPEAYGLETVEDIPEPDACDCVDECIFSAEDMQILTGTPEEDIQEKSHSKLYKHAERELILRGDDKQFTDMFLNMITCFSSYGHSGSSAEHSIQTIERLLRWQNLTKLTNDPDEWSLVNPGSNPTDLLWQSKRNPSAFTTDSEFDSYYLTGDRDVLILTEKVIFNPER